MREIKFRVWCKQTEEMHTVEKMGFNEGELWYVEDEDHETQPPYFVGNNDWNLIQYTGLKDSAENEIYEGDILEDVINKKRYKVIWDSYGMFLFYPVGFEGEALDYYEFEMEVSNVGTMIIGNIYQNPELV